jgi:hypothetical protein
MMAREPATAELVYKPAKRERVGLIIGLSGPSGAGKTFSALRLARGIAGPSGRVAVLDTENGRAAHYADMFEFLHAELNEPFRATRYAEMAARSKAEGHDVLVIDSMSHEHAGPGGMLEYHEEELQRMVPDGDYGRREAMKMVAWIKPKMEHKAMVQRLLQLNSHLVLCFRAEEKTELRPGKNRTGKDIMVPTSIGFQPICDKNMPYEMTIMLGFDPKAPGIPQPIKLQDQHRPMVPLNRPLNESAGAALAAWARGEKPPSATAKSQVQPPPAPEQTPEPPPAPPPGNDKPPSELPLGDEPASSGNGKTQAVAEALIARFEAVKVRADHLAIVDVKADRDRITWIKKNRPEIGDRLKQAMEASWARTMPAKENAA